MLVEYERRKRYWILCNLREYSLGVIFRRKEPEPDIFRNGHLKISERQVKITKKHRLFPGQLQKDGNK